MQTINNVGSSDFFPSTEKLSPDAANQRRMQQLNYRSTFWLRTLRFWWYRILLIILCGGLAALLSQLSLNYTLKVFGGIIALFFVFLAIRRLEFGLLLSAIIAIIPLPQILVVKGLVINPALVLLLLLFLVIVGQKITRSRQSIFPSFKFTWPLIALIVVALFSELTIQIIWAPGVPHQMNSNPLIFEDALGIFILLVPLICLTVTTAALTNRERWVEYIQYGYLIVALSISLLIMLEFKRTGVDVYRFRFVQPSIGWMDLRDLALITGLGSIVAYARLLYADRWRTRGIYGGILLLCLLGTYLTLYNSEWIEVVIALVVMTATHSLRRFLCYCVAGLFFIPLLLPILNKVFSAKSNQDASRLFVWRDMLRIWGKYPVLGVGPGNLWNYDQYFTQLPPTLRNFATSGLGVAHNGYLQVLGETGFVGLFFWLAFIIIFATTALRLFRRSNTPETQSGRRLALIGLGIISGSAIADCFSGAYILVPRQVGGFNTLSSIFSLWIIFGCIIFKYQSWRRTRNG